MWDFSFAIPSLLILGLLLLFYFSLPRLHIRMNRAFLIILVAESAVIISDIVSSLVDNDIGSFPLALVHLANVIYFASFFVRAAVLFLYTASVLRVLQLSRSKIVSLLYFPSLACIILTILSPFYGFIYYIEDGQYYSGPLYDLL